MKFIVLFIIWSNFFNVDIINENNFKTFKHKAKLLENTVAQADNAANEILKNAALAVSLRFSSNFWRSHEIPLINCKEELKLEWWNHCVLVMMRMLFLVLKAQIYMLM